MSSFLHQSQLEFKKGVCSYLIFFTYIYVSYLTNKVFVYYYLDMVNHIKHF